MLHVLSVVAVFNGNVKAGVVEETRKYKMDHGQGVGREGTGKIQVV